MSQKRFTEKSSSRHYPADDLLSALRHAAANSGRDSSADREPEGYAAILKARWFPIPNPDESLSEEWVEGKTPSNAYTRAYLARTTRAWRSFLFELFAETEAQGSAKEQSFWARRQQVRAEHFDAKCSFMQAEAVFKERLTDAIIDGLLKALHQRSAARRHRRPKTADSR